jgi:hypothetical protein
MADIGIKAPIRADTRIKEAANRVTRWASDNGLQNITRKDKNHADPQKERIHETKETLD